MLDHRQLGLGSARGEKIDTARTLLVAEVMADLADTYPLERLIEVLDIPRANDVSRTERAAEMLAIREFYPADFIAYAYAHPPTWHLLVEPARWPEADTVRDEVVTFFRDRLGATGAWPSIDALRVRFGRHPIIPKGRVHPTEKPVALMADLIRKAPPGVVFDPFMGSGSTLRAAKDLGRRSIGVEIDERHVEMAVRRLGQDLLFAG